MDFFIQVSLALACLSFIPVVVIPIIAVGMLPDPDGLLGKVWGWSCLVSIALCALFFTLYHIGA